LLIVLASVGVPPSMVVTSRHFYDGVDGRMRRDNDECSDCFGMGQGVGQECVVEPVLFKT
ncbi:MAG: hypothetical protein ABJI00_02850, partial [Paracoccaceae bacterium]